MTDSSQKSQNASAMTSAIIAITLAVLAFFIPGLGILLAIGAIFMGRRASALAVAQSDGSAKTLAKIAVVISWIGLIGAIIVLLVLGGGVLSML